MGLEIIRTAGEERRKTYEEGKKTLKRRDIKGNKKPIDDARIFDSEGQDLKELLKG